MYKNTGKIKTQHLETL